MKERTQIRIVAGSLRGRRLTVVVHPGLRPTPQMVREALFSILGNAVPGRPFFDVFAGTGVVGLEALSRGASQALFVERDFRLTGDIEQHLRDFGVADRAQLLRTDAYRWVERWRPPADRPVNVFFSPPFADLTERLDDFLGLVSATQGKAPPGSVVAVQAEDPFPTDRLTGTDWDVRKYGRNLLLFWVKPDEAPPPDAPPT
jgi:16S rRNA (guanine(966)-N(2))-methyltransferase RsmD